jgi:acetyltransferase-like isoleucine patch superfamily enzyme
MRKVKSIFCAFILFLFPTRLVFWLVNLFGHKLSSGARVGFSFVFISGKLSMNKHTRIGHLNIVRIDNLSMAPGSYIGKLNSIKGPFDIILKERGAIGNGNKIDRAPLGVSYGKAVLQLGLLSKLTANHRLDLMRSVVFGDYTTLAGHDSQIWTHSYYHDEEGAGRFRVDGEVIVGDNVYIGSRCILTPGVSIVSKITVGANSCVSKSLTEVGTYVNSSLRFFEKKSQADLKDGFQKVTDFEVCEEVFERRNHS